MNAQEIIQKAIPEANNDLCEYILWAMTPFPCGAVSPRSLFKAADRLKRANANGRRLCDFCNNEVHGDDWTCPSCTRALSQ